MISEQRMQRRTLNEILPLSQIIYVIGNNNLKCIFFMTYCQIINFFSWFGPWKVNIYQTAYHSLTHWYTLTFLIIFNLINNLYLCPLGISVYVQTAGPTDFQNVTGISSHPFLLISLLTKIIFRVSQKIHLLFLTIFPLN